VHSVAQYEAHWYSAPSSAHESWSGGRALAQLADPSPAMQSCAQELEPSI
jgi:hypothetical protein